jgi:hypothetical protein
MISFDAIECQDYMIALELKEIKFKIYAGQVKYEQDNAKIPQANVKRQTGLDEPTGFTEFCKSASEEDKFTKIDESEIWAHITNYFEFAESNMLRITKKPEWDPIYAERYETTNHLMSVDELENTIHTYYQFIKNYEKKICVINPVTVCKKIDSALQNKRSKELDKAAIDLSYEPQERDYLREWLEAMQAKDINVVYDLFRHWLWQVKRNLNGRATVNQLFIVLRSATQGLGKTYTIKYLLNPIKKFSLNSDLSNVMEERSFGSDSSKYLVLNFDEMSGADKACINKLKTWTTEANVSYRPMGTNNSKNVKKIASGIGTSNHAMSSYLRDNTGNRRFVEIDLCAKKRPEITNTAEFIENGEAWLSIWKNIDENLERGYHNPDDATQKTYIADCLSNSSADTDFFRDMFIWDSKDNQRYNHRIDTIFMVYKKYCRSMGFKEKGKIQFIQSCETMIDTKKFKDMEMKNYSGHKILKLPALSEYFATLTGVKSAYEFKNKDNSDMFIYIDDTKIDDTKIDDENKKAIESKTADIAVNNSFVKQQRILISPNRSNND